MLLLLMVPSRILRAANNVVIPSQKHVCADSLTREPRFTSYHEGGVQRFRANRPEQRPVGIKGKTDIVEALTAIQAKAAPFISRGDRSGTDIAELELWKTAGIEIAKERGPWYKEIGQGIGAALNTAAAANATYSPTAAPGCRSRTAAVS